MAPAITPVEFFAALVDWYSPEKVQMKLTLSLYRHHLPPRQLPEKLVELVGLQAVRQGLAPARKRETACTFVAKAPGFPMHGQLAVMAPGTPGNTSVVVILDIPWLVLLACIAKDQHCHHCCFFARAPGPLADNVARPPLPTPAGACASGRPALPRYL